MENSHLKGKGPILKQQQQQKKRERAVNYEERQTLKMSSVPVTKIRKKWHVTYGDLQTRLIRY